MRIKQHTYIRNIIIHFELIAMSAKAIDSIFTIKLYINKQIYI